jgi:hypothetical protein
MLTPMSLMSSLPEIQNLPIMSNDRGMERKKIGKGLLIVTLERDYLANFMSGKHVLPSDLPRSSA